MDQEATMTGQTTLTPTQRAVLYRAFGPDPATVDPLPLKAFAVTCAGLLYAVLLTGIVFLGHLFLSVVSTLSREGALRHMPWESDLGYLFTVLIVSSAVFVTLFLGTWLSVWGSEPDPATPEEIRLVAEAVTGLPAGTVWDSGPPAFRHDSAVSGARPRVVLGLRREGHHSGMAWVRVSALRRNMRPHHDADGNPLRVTPPPTTLHWHPTWRCLEVVGATPREALSDTARLLRDFAHTTGALTHLPRHVGADLDVPFTITQSKDGTIHAAVGDNGAMVPTVLPQQVDLAALPDDALLDALLEAVWPAWASAHRDALHGATRPPRQDALAARRDRVAQIVEELT